MPYTQPFVEDEESPAVCKQVDDTNEDKQASTPHGDGGNEEEKDLAAAFTKCSIADATSEPTCAVCKKGKPAIPQIMKCSRCKSIFYCSATCQKADWQAHKPNCGKKSGSSSASTSASQSSPLNPPKGLEQPISNPFTRLRNRTWLHGRPEADVYRLLIDVYRMRIEDVNKFTGEACLESIYGGEVSDGRAGLAEMLRRCASTHRDLLPPWWTEAKAAECVRFGLGFRLPASPAGARAGDEWYGLQYAIEKADVIEHYGDARFPMQLRMFGEDVYDSPPAGAASGSKASMLEMMVAGETCGGYVYSL